jgi:transcriptional regulator GlxA family with amidase domain
MNFGFVLFPDLEELDLVGPWEMVAMWARTGQGPGRRLLLAETNEPVRCAQGMAICPDATLAECPQLDYLLVPGGDGARDVDANEAVVQFIEEQAPRFKAILSVCTGTFLLNRAGILAGRRATTHWTRLDQLRELPDLEVVEERFTHDGPVWTAAGVSAGIDMLLAFIAEVAGDSIAGQMQLGAEYYPSMKRYGSLDKHPKAPEYVRATAR